MVASHTWTGERIGGPGGDWDHMAHRRWWRGDVCSGPAVSLARCVRDRAALMQVMPRICGHVSTSLDEPKAQLAHMTGTAVAWGSEGGSDACRDRDRWLCVALVPNPLEKVSGSRTGLPLS